MMHIPAVQVPPPLKPGDLLRVVSPSGAIKEWDGFQAGVQVWRDRGYRVELTPGYDHSWGYLAGDDQTRLQAFLQAWTDPACQGILCARGGYGSARLTEAWVQQLAGKVPAQKEEFLEILRSPALAPKWLIGFSDVTNLLWLFYQLGISGVHAPLLTTLALEPDWSKQRLFDWVQGKPLEPLKGKGWGGGIVQGTLLPGNLTVATHLLGTPLQPALQGVILALEDVTELPYRIDRTLTQWRLAGALDGVVGIALGRFSRCEGPAGSFTVEEVLRDRLADLKIPIVSDLPFGHDGSNAALPVGYPVQLDGDQGTLQVLNPEQ